eukprot:6384399-Karenia_brevis.AAC.1
MEKFYDNISIPHTDPRSHKAWVSPIGAEAAVADAHGLQKHQMLPVSPWGHHTNQWHHCRMHTKHHFCQNTPPCYMSGGI